jgi:purine-binding chemotaxis protein CheW
MNGDFPMTVTADAGAAERARILHTRAVALAHKPEPAKKAGARIEFVEFTLAGERYGIESSFVREVQGLKGLAPIPCTPPFILGVVNIRGQILAVIDLRKFFDLPTRGISDLDKLIVIRSATIEFGILADAIIGMRTIEMAGVQPSLPTLSGIRADYLKGITGDRTVLLDAEKLLHDKRIIVSEEVET